MTDNDAFGLIGLACIIVYVIRACIAFYEDLM
jgi:hypothetical protein